MEHVIVERVFPEPVELADVERAAAQGKHCYEARRVKLLRSTLSRDGLRMICEYEAPDAETVRVANQLAGAKFERIWTARVFTPSV